jgi:predicted O-methyltransferase YrrM
VRLARPELEALVSPIDGWLGLDEAWALHEAARNCLERTRAPVAVEIGSWKGRSTTAIATAFATGRRGVLFAVDPHAGTATHARAGVTDTLAQLEHTISTVGVTDHVRVVRAPSATARTAFEPESVHLLFVDGSHRYDDVVHDTLAWQPQLAPGATVAFHDAVTRRDVRRAIDRHVLRTASGYRAARLVGNTLFATWLGRDGGVRFGRPTALPTRLRVAEGRARAKVGGVLVPWRAKAGG